MIFHRFIGFSITFSGHDSQIPLKINKFDTTKGFGNKTLFSFGVCGSHAQKKGRKPYKSKENHEIG